MDSAAWQVLIISGSTFLTIVSIILLFRGRISGIELGKNKISMGKDGIIMEPDAARLYTREAVRLTNLIGDLERRQLLSEMMKHGEEGLTIFCNTVRSDFREYVFLLKLPPDEADDLIHENELVVNQIEREMHGWILLAMRQNSIPTEDSKLDWYVKEKYTLWDGGTDEIRRKCGRCKMMHANFLITAKQYDDKYFKIIFSMFKKAAKAEEVVKDKIECAIKARQTLEDSFVMTAKVVFSDC